MLLFFKKEALPLPVKRTFELRNQIRLFPSERTLSGIRLPPKMPISGSYRINRIIKLKVLADSTRPKVHQFAQGFFKLVLVHLKRVAVQLDID